LARASIASSPHLHALFADGVFVEHEGTVRFRVLASPTIGELNAISWTIYGRTLARLRERGLWLDAEPGNDSLAANQPLLASLANASLSGTLLFGEAGQRSLRLFASVSSGTNAGAGVHKSNNGFGFANASRSVSGAK